jgi:hypothetical protein
MQRRGRAKAAARLRATMMTEVELGIEVAAVGVEAAVVTAAVAPGEMTKSLRSVETFSGDGVRVAILARTRTRRTPIVVMTVLAARTGVATMGEAMMAPQRRIFRHVPQHSPRTLLIWIIRFHVISPTIAWERSSAGKVSS